MVTLCWRKWTLNWYHVFYWWFTIQFNVVAKVCYWTFTFESFENTKFVVRFSWGTISIGYKNCRYCLKIGIKWSPAKRWMVYILQCLFIRLLKNFRSNTHKLNLAMPWIKKNLLTWLDNVNWINFLYITKSFYNNKSTF